ncbi:MAG TPA: flagellar export chaperone FliS [Desulfobacteraceae bacterium]|nr:flagellar export chaperone FliS [Desulfobacteraceae bacterium]
MVYGNALQSYRKAQVSGEADPQKLILMLYEAAIKRLHLAKEGLETNDPRKRGENMGKAIAIISELNASLDENIKTEEINFLRSLYMTMMTELTKVAVTKDVKTVDRAIKYMSELKRIWEETVMKKSKANPAASPTPAAPQPKTPQANPQQYPAYGNSGFKAQSIAV